MSDKPHPLLVKLFGGDGSVFRDTAHSPHTDAFVMKRFDPFSMYSSPSRRSAHEVAALLVEEADGVDLSRHSSSTFQRLVRSVDLGRPRRDALASKRAHQIRNTR